MSTELVPIVSSLPVRRRRSYVDLITSGTFRHDNLLDEVGRSLQAQGCLLRRQRLEGICSHVDKSFMASGWAPHNCHPVGADNPKEQFRIAFSNSIIDHVSHVVVFTTRFDLRGRFIRRWGRRFRWDRTKFAAVMIGDRNPRMLNELAKSASGVFYQLEQAPAIAAAMPSLLEFVQ